jgi:hypothetical protein
VKIEADYREVVELLDRGTLRGIIRQSGLPRSLFE